jgi:hypothetical protein
VAVWQRATRAKKLYITLDSLHIPIWLFKDIAWLMVWKPLGVAMVLPAMAVAVYLCLATIGMHKKFLLNLAILFWISANSLWMLGEFFDWHFQPYSATLFVSGIVVMAFFFKTRRGV